MKLKTLIIVFFMGSKLRFISKLSYLVAKIYVNKCLKLHLGFEIFARKLDLHFLFHVNTMKREKQKYTSCFICQNYAVLYTLVQIHSRNICMSFKPAHEPYYECIPLYVNSLYTNTSAF